MRSGQRAIFHPSDPGGKGGMDICSKKKHQAR